MLMTTMTDLPDLHTHKVLAWIRTGGEGRGFANSSSLFTKDGEMVTVPGLVDQSNMKVDGCAKIRSAASLAN
jgi:hypothetical protein